jgi:hypothetical protein
MPTRLLFEIVFYGAILFWVAALAAETSQGKATERSVLLVKMRGQVEIHSPDHELIAWRAAAAKDSLADGSLIATGESPSFAELCLPDNSILRLAPDSCVEIDAATHRIFLKEGGLVFSRARTPTNHPYQLYTAAHLVIPSGTVRLSTGRSGDECINLETGKKTDFLLLKAAASKKSK